MPPPGRLIILFIRHGETQDNIDRVLQGHHDTDLTPKGHYEAKVLADKLINQQIDIIYHSPLRRILQTIDPILKTWPNIPTHADPDLKGQALGELEGAKYDTIDMGNQRSADGQPGVELFDDFVTRLKHVFGRIIGAEAPQVQGQDRVVVIATHGVGITTILKVLEATYPNFNTAIAIKGPEAYEVRWTDSDDVSRVVVNEPARLPVKDGSLDYATVKGFPFVIEYWGKKEKAL